MKHVRLRSLVLLSLVLIGAFEIVWAQGSEDPKLQAQLKQLFPDAASFSGKEGAPPHFKVYGPGQTLTGVAFYTTDVTPRERGYDGPIKILVGMDTAGILTGIIVVAHHEPFGYRSIDRPSFPAQFVGKNIRDPFRVGADIDWMSRATISVTSASRGIRDGARAVADKVLPSGR